MPDLTPLVPDGCSGGSVLGSNSATVCISPPKLLTMKTLPSCAKYPDRWPSFHSMRTAGSPVSSALPLQVKPSQRLTEPTVECSPSQLVGLFTGIKQKLTISDHVARGIYVATSVSAVDGFLRTHSPPESSKLTRSCLARHPACRPSGEVHLNG
jgi:hypothetical protein